MAGIGAELRKLTRQDDLLGLVQGYTHAAVASSGPWLLTVLSLGGLTLYGSVVASYEELATFRLIIIYNFAFSLVLSGPVVMVATRAVADLIHEKRLDEAPAVMLSSLVLLYGTQAAVVGPFYLWYVDLALGTRLAALANYFLITGIWLVSVFLTALKNYSAVTRSFAIGMALGFGGAVLLAPTYSVTGMLVGFSGGLAYVLFSIIARIFAEYPYRVIRLFRMLDQIKKYWELALGGLVYNMAIWVDKWLMWLSPHHVVLASGLVSYPDYDSAMFLAYLSIVPSMAVFVFQVETSFFEKYLIFYRDIERHATYGRIQSNHEEIIRTLLVGARNLVVVQGGICFVTVLLAPRLLELLGVPLIQLSMFRFGVLGAFFHVLFLVITIFLSYFDLRRVSLLLQSIFLATNMSFTYVGMQMGFAYYGYGYFLSALTSFAIAFCVAAHYIVQLPYQTFIHANTSVR